MKKENLKRSQTLMSTQQESFKSQIADVNLDILKINKKLTTKISGLGEGLGIYEEQILELVAGVNQTQEKGRESVELLTNKVKKMAADVEAMVSAGLA